MREGFGGIEKMETAVTPEENLQISLKKATYTETENFPDMAFYYMMVDVAIAKEPIVFNAKPVFKTDTKHPMIDTLDVDKALVVRLLYGQ